MRRPSWPCWFVDWAWDCQATPHPADPPRSPLNAMARWLLLAALRAADRFRPEEGDRA